MSDNLIDSNVASTPAGSEIPATSAPAVTQGTPAPNVAGATPNATAQPPATGGAPEGYVPSYRLREARETAVRQANEQFAQREAVYRAEMERYQEQVRRLVGVNSPANPEIEAVKSQFGGLYPGLAKLEQRAADIERLIERTQDLETQTEHYWQSHGQRTMDNLFSKAAETYGAPMTEEGKRALHSSFVGWIQSSPELQERYVKDPSVVDDFWRAFSASFIDPARRTATAAAVGRVPTGLPQDTPGGVPHIGSPAPKPANLDEAAQLAYARFQNFKSGGQ